MSDAPQQPQLRLKPRLKNEADPSQPPPPPLAPPSPTPESPKDAPTTTPSLAFKLRAQTPPPTADLAPSPAAPPPAPAAEAFSPPPALTPQDPSPATIPPTASRAPVPALNTPDPEQIASAKTEISPRLKLRGIEPEAAPTPAVPEASDTAETIPAEADKPGAEATLRKTFKLSSKPPVTPHPHPEGVPPAFLVETPASEPAPAPDQSSQPIASAPAPSPAETGPHTSAPPPSGLPKPPPVTKPNLAPPGIPPRAKIPHFKGSEKLNLPAEKLPLGAKPAPKKNTKPLRVVALLVLLLLVGGACYFGYEQFIKPAPTPVAAPTAQKPSPVATTPPAQEKQPSPTPAPLTPPAATEGSGVDPSSIAHLPSKLISKAQESIAARRNIEQERIDNPGEGAESPEGRGFPLSKTGADPTPATTEKQAASYSSIAPGIAATDSSIKTSGKPGTSFRRVVSDLNIRGVFQGSPSRAHINGRIVLAGNPIDKELGIIFVGVNAEEKMLVFRDATGATVSRRY